MDPNQIIGTPTERWVWLAPDWTGFKPETAQRPSGYNRVRVREVLFADGRRVTLVLDENGQPVGADGVATTPDKARVLDQTTDDDQAKKYKEQQTAANKPPEERNNNGRRERWNPAKGGWEDVGPAINTTAPSATGTVKPPVPPGGSSVIEGTPDANKPGGWDNQRPREVIRDKDGTIVWTGELQGADLTAWRNNQQAGQPQTGEQRVPVDTHPGWTKVTRKKIEGNNTTEVVTYVGPDGKEVPTLPEKPKDPSVQLVTINGQPGYQVRTTPGVNGQPPTIQWFDPSGNPLAKPPVEAGKPNVSVTTVNGRRYTTTTVINPDNTVTITNLGPDGKPIAEIPQEGQVKLPDDAPKIDLTDEQTAYDSYMQLLGYVDNLVRTGKMTNEQAKAAMALPEQQVKSKLERGNQEREQARQQRQDQMTLARDAEARRNNRAVMSSSMFSNAASAANGAKVRGDLTPSYIALQAGLNQASGAYNEYPEVAAIGIGKPPLPGPTAAGPNAIGVPTAPPGVMRPGGPLPPPLLTGPQPPAAYPGAPAPQNAGAGTGEPPSRGAAAAQVAPPAPPAPRPAPAPAAAAAQSAAGNERPDDIITITIPSGRQEKVTRTEYEAGLAQGLWRKEWVTNAEPASAASPTTPLTPPYGKPQGTPQPGDNQNPGGSVLPPPPAPINPQLPPNEQTMTSGGWSAPMDEASAMAPAPQVAAVGGFGQPVTMQQRRQEMIAEGFSEQEVDEAIRRTLARHGGMAA